MQLSYDGNWLRFMAHNSCGEYIVGPVLITVMAETEEWLETIQACDSYTLESGSEVTESQVIDYEYYDPCFRVVHQPIEISHSDHVTESITSCHESLVWNGMTFFMRNAGLEETQAEIKIARRNINNLRYADDTTLMAERNSKAS